MLPTELPSLVYNCIVALGATSLGFYMEGFCFVFSLQYMFVHSQKSFSFLFFFFLKLPAFKLQFGATSNVSPARGVF